MYSIFITLLNTFYMCFFIKFFWFISEWRNFCVNSLKYITEQPSDLKHLIPSLITLNSNRLLNIYNSEPKAADDLPQVIYNERLNLYKM